MIDTQRLTTAFVELTDTLVDDFDLLDFLTTLIGHCADLLGPAEAGIMLLDNNSDLHLMASTNENMRILEIFELQNNEGPCLDVLHQEDPIVNHRVRGAGSRWPQFDSEAETQGFEWAHAFPMHVRTTSIGAINIFSAADRQLDAVGAAVGQALADVASVAILQERALRESRVVNEQLESALNSRVIIEQAKGVLAERLSIDVDQGFDRLRRYARSRNLHLTDVGAAVVDGTFNTDNLAP